MSYSRWSNSEWYTYWCSGTSHKQSAQCLSISYSISDGKDITYGELKELGSTGIVDKMKGLFPDASEKDIKSLLGYIDEFMDDVEGNIEE
jgi:hypothetical protein